MPSGKSMIRINSHLSVSLLILAIIGLINWYFAPTMSDDILYRFIWQEDWQSPFERITNIGDVIESQIIHYQVVNGRTVTHTLAQIMLNLVPEIINKMMNTVVFLLLIWLVAMFTAERKSDRPLIALLAFGMIFLFISGFMSAFIWMPYTYLWALTMTISLLVILKRNKDEKAGYQLIWLLPLSFIAGWSHEAIALPLSIAFICYICFEKEHRKISVATLCMMAYILGAAMIIKSPSLWMRADIEGITIQQRMLYGIINMVTNTRVSWLLVFTLLWIGIKSKNRLFETIRENSYLLIAWMMAMGIVIVCGSTIERVAICADFLAMLTVLRIWQENGLTRFKNAVSAVIIILSVAIAVPAIAMNRMNHQHYSYHQQQLQQTDHQLIKVRQLPADMNWCMNMIAERYVFPTIEFGFYSCYMAFDSYDSNTKALAALYQKDNVICLPEDVVEHIEKDSTAYTRYETDKHGTLYIQRIADSMQVADVIFELGPEVELKPWQHFLSYKGDAYKLDHFKYKVVSICNHPYLVMTVPTTNIKRRIEKIRIEAVN